MRIIYNRNFLILATAFTLIAFLIRERINIPKQVKQVKQVEQKYIPEQLDSNCSLDMGASFETRINKLRYIKHLEK
jgi:hypothetical protein